LFRLSFLGFNFLAGLLLAALMGATSYGSLSLLLVNAAVFYIITGLGADSSLIWHVSGGKIGKEAGYSLLLVTGFIQLLLFGIISIGYWQIFGSTLLSGGDPDNYFFPELYYFTGIILVEKFSAIFYAIHRAAFVNIILAIISFGFCIVLGGLYWGFWEKGDLIILFCRFTFFQGIILFFVFQFAQWSLSPGIIRRDLWRSLFQFSMIVFLTNTVQFLAYRLDYWLIDAFLKSEEVGIYAQANRFANLIWVLPNVLAALLIPKITQREAPLTATELVAQIRLVNWLNIGLLFLIILGAMLAYNWILPGEYFIGWLALVLMLPGYYLFSMALLLAAWFSGHRQLRVNLTGTLICFALILIADLILIPTKGIYGAALANTFAYSLTSLYFIDRFLSVNKISVRRFWFKGK